MQMLDSRGGSTDYDSPSAPMQSTASQSTPPQSQPASQPQQAPAASDSGFDSFDDDIPF